MPRGRPRKVPQVAPTSEALLVADYLSKHCSTPGCVAKFHLEEAHDLLVILGRNTPVNRITSTAKEV